MIGQCIECGEHDDLEPGSGLCNLCIAEISAAEERRLADIDSGRASLDEELMDEFFEVDGNGIRS